MLWVWEEVAMLVMYDPHFSNKQTDIPQPFK